MGKTSYVVVSGAKDEADYIRLTIDSVVKQTQRPVVWIIFDDGSSDGTPEIVEAASLKYPWIKLIKGKPAGSRQPGFAAVNAVEQAAGELSKEHYEYLSIVDADVTFGPKYFETLLSYFDENPLLGIASGQAYEQYGDGTLRRHRAEPELTVGVVKTYRAKCLQAIGGLVRHIGWEAIDCYKAMMLGWKTDTFQDEVLKIVHLRPTGSSVRSVYRGRKQRGKAMYFTGSHPVWIVASTFYHFLDKPYLLGGLCMLIGYIESAVTGASRLDDQRLVRFVRVRQLKRLSQVFKLS